MENRIGLGEDLHRLSAGRPFMLGGVKLEADFGPLGHSDGDALLHAITDALLGALGKGDIGTHFPDTDPAFKDADSASLLTQVVTLIKQEGYRVVNLDTTVRLEKPKLSPYRTAICKNLAHLLEVPETCVSVKAKTSEGLGAVGQGQAVATQAVVLLEKTS